MKVPTRMTKTPPMRYRHFRHLRRILRREVSIGWGMTGYGWGAWLFGVCFFPLPFGPLIVFHVGPLVVEVHLVRWRRA